MAALQTELYGVSGSNLSGLHFERGPCCSNESWYSGGLGKVLWEHPENSWRKDEERRRIRARGAVGIVHKQHDGEA